jgi:hypothetical protein
MAEYSTVLEALSAEPTEPIDERRFDSIDFLQKFSRSYPTESRIIADVAKVLKLVNDTAVFKEYLDEIHEASSPIEEDGQPVDSNSTLGVALDAYTLAVADFYGNHMYQTVFEQTRRFGRVLLDVFTDNDDPDTGQHTTVISLPTEESPLDGLQGTGTHGL